MPARPPASAAYRGRLNPDSPGPAWAWALGACAPAVLALALCALLVGWRPSGSHMLGPLAAGAAGAVYGVFGLAAWWPVPLLGLMAVQLWKGRTAAPLIWVAGGGIWLLMASAALLGHMGALYHGALPAGGGAGAAMAAGLTASAGAVAAYAVPGLMAAAGLGLCLWAVWPALMTLRPAPGEPRPAREPEPAEPAEPPAPEPEPALEPEPAPEEPAVTSPPDPPAQRDDGQGPRIKPRAPRPAQVALRQEALTFPGGGFTLPSLELLREPEEPPAAEQAESLKHNSRLLEKKLADFGVQGQVEEVAPGPVVTMYEFKPAPGVKISKVAGLADDLAMNLRATSIRIVAPIPGKAVIGIEIPNQARETVYLREILASKAYGEAAGPLTVALGKDILGSPMVTDLTRMPHLLIAGSTGSGKSVFINSLVLSILYKAGPDQARMLMVDPKRIELSAYNDIPHLLHPIITSPQDATAGLRWAVGEMERRYELLAHLGVRNIRSFNQRLKKGSHHGPEGEELVPLPYLVIIIDELADLMMVASKEVEALITRLAQMARAAGIHLVLATQRPSVDVITGLIKANFPSRISFRVTSRADSRVILDQQGAEHLLGNGDMLFTPPGTSQLIRIHGAFVSDRESEEVVRFLRSQARPDYDESITQAGPGDGEDVGGEEQDERYHDAVALVKQTGQASISYVQRRLRVGYNRAARMIEQMEREGIVGPSDGSRPREVLIRD